MNLAMSVLVNDHLFLRIGAYQSGVYMELRTLVKCYRNTIPHHRHGFLLSALKLPFCTLLPRLFRCCPEFFPSTFLDSLIAFGYDRAAYYLMNFIKPTAAAPVLAVFRGQLETMKMVLPKNPDDTRLMDIAAENGHVHIVEYLYSCGFGCTSYALDRAAGRGFINVVVFLDSIVNAECTTEAMDRAAANGHIEVVRFLLDHRTEGCTSDAIDDAAINGHSSIVIFLHAHGKPFTTRAVDGATTNGHRKLIEFFKNSHE